MEKTEKQLIFKPLLKEFETKNIALYFIDMVAEIPDYILSKYQIGQRLSDACREIGRLGDRLGYLYEIINVCMEQYADTEIENKRNADAFL